MASGRWSWRSVFVPLLLGGALDVAVASDVPAASNVCPAVAEHKIVFMGSSVCFGATASPVGGTFSFYQSYGAALRGYAFDHAVALNGRFKQGLGANWDVSNISVGGNSTPNVLARWTKDLLPQCGRYVVYGLSLANEGIMTNPSAFDQFKTNMAKLIQDARGSGMVPLVVNNYANNDYTPALYSKIQSMNLLIHQWDVPTINVMGAIDDGAGHWAPGYFTSAGHPNDQGYAEMAASFVPSLFDALQAGTPRPQKQTTSFATLNSGDQVEFHPEAGLHSFTVIVDIRTASPGPLLGYKDGAAAGGVFIDPTGVLVYQTSKTGKTFKGQVPVNDGAWHTVAFTHYVSMSKTILYVDAVKQIEVSADGIHSDEFSLGGPNARGAVDFRNLLFYRAGMTQVELNAIKSGAFLQSSLEIYAPLDGQGKILAAAIANLAQSTNLLSARSVGAGGPMGSGGVSDAGDAGDVGGAGGAGGEPGAAGAAGVAGGPGTGGATNPAGDAEATAGSAGAGADAAVDLSAGGSNASSGLDIGCGCSLPGSQSVPFGAFASGALVALTGILAQSRRRRRKPRATK